MEVCARRVTVARFLAQGQQMRNRCQPPQKPLPAAKVPKEPQLQHKPAKTSLQRDEQQQRQQGVGRGLGLSADYFDRFRFAGSSNQSSQSPSQRPTVACNVHRPHVHQPVGTSSAASLQPSAITSGPNNSNFAFGASSHGVSLHHAAAGGARESGVRHRDRSASCKEEGGGGCGVKHMTLLQDKVKQVPTTPNVRRLPVTPLAPRLGTTNGAREANNGGCPTDSPLDELLRSCRNGTTQTEMAALASVGLPMRPPRSRTVSGQGSPSDLSFLAEIQTPDANPDQFSRPPRSGCSELSFLAKIQTPGANPDRISRHPRSGHSDLSFLAKIQTPDANPDRISRHPSSTCSMSASYHHTTAHIARAASQERISCSTALQAFLHAKEAGGGAITTSSIRGAFGSADSSTTCNQLQEPVWLGFDWALPKDSMALHDVPSTQECSYPSIATSSTGANGRVIACSSVAPPVSISPTAKLVLAPCGTSLVPAGSLLPSRDPLPELKFSRSNYAHLAPQGEGHGQAHVQAMDASIGWQINKESSSNTTLSSAVEGWLGGGDVDQGARERACSNGRDISTRSCGGGGDGCSTSSNGTSVAQPSKRPRAGTIVPCMAGRQKQPRMRAGRASTGLRAASMLQLGDRYRMAAWQQEHQQLQRQQEQTSAGFGQQASERPHGFERNLAIATYASSAGPRRSALQARSGDSSNTGPPHTTEYPLMQRLQVLKHSCKDHQ